MNQKIKFKQTEIGRFPEDWEEHALGELGEVIGGGTPSTSKPEYYNGNIAWITPRDLSNHKEIYVDKGERSITKEGLDNSSAKLMPKETVLFTSRAPIGYVAIAKNQISTNQGFKSIVCGKRLNNKFLYYWLKKNKERIEALASGSTFKEVSGSTLKSTLIVLPEFLEQGKIAKILFDLDSQIEVLQEQNKTLETIGKSIFKKWFIDFKFANEEGKPYKASGGGVIESEIGEVVIDENSDIALKKGKLGDIMSLEYGKSLSKDKRLTGNIPVYGSGGVYGATEKSLVEGPGLIVGRAGRPGTVYISGVDFYPVDSTFHVSTEKEYMYYLYFLLKKLELGRLNTGSAVPGLNRNNAYILDIEYPKKKDLVKFNKICNGLFKKLWCNESEITNLEKIRNKLSGVLFSGKIRAPVEVKK